MDPQLEACRPPRPPARRGGGRGCEPVRSSAACALPTHADLASLRPSCRDRGPHLLMKQRRLPLEIGGPERGARAQLAQSPGASGRPSEEHQAQPPAARPVVQQRKERFVQSLSRSARQTPRTRRTEIIEVVRPQYVSGRDHQGDVVGRQVLAQSRQEADESLAVVAELRHRARTAEVGMRCCGAGYRETRS